MSGQVMGRLFSFLLRVLRGYVAEKQSEGVQAISSMTVFVTVEGVMRNDIFSVHYMKYCYICHHEKAIATGEQR